MISHQSLMRKNIFWRFSRNGQIGVPAGGTGAPADPRGALSEKALRARHGRGPGQGGAGREAPGLATQAGCGQRGRTARENLLDCRRESGVKRASRLGAERCDPLVSGSLWAQSRPRRARRARREAGRELAAGRGPGREDPVAPAATLADGVKTPAMRWARNPEAPLLGAPG